MYQDQEKYKAYQKNYRDAHKEERRVEKRTFYRKYREKIRDKRKTYEKAYRIINREKIRQQRRLYMEKYRKDHPEKVRLSNLNYTRKNRDKARNWSNAHHARKYSNGRHDLTADQWHTIKIHFGYRCAYCGRKMQRLTMDHITPISQGGEHTLSNVVPACKSCNSKKGNRGVLNPVQPLML